MNEIKLVFLQVTLVLCAVAPVAGAFPLLAADAPLRVCATVPDLGDLVKIVGGDQVEVTVFAKGGEDPHMVEAKPSFIKALAGADLFVMVGMELEIGWAPALLQNSRNAAVLQGGRGYLDVSKVISPLEVPTTAVDRSMGDVHPEGNPHFLLDPLNGLRVAGAIRDKLAELRPSAKDGFIQRYTAFRKDLCTRLAGESLAAKYDVEKLAVLAEHGKLIEFLKSQNDEGLLGGWFAKLAPHADTKLVADHNLWPYFAQRFGMQVIEQLEPKPGLPPTSKHLSAVLKRMKQEGAKAILASPYYDARHADLIAKQSGATVARMCHQCGAIEKTGTYLAMVDYNVRTLATALGASK
jgi:ABC-type Zn uptake system ZnuABC Zn-binding protein ZnuA